MNFIIFKGFELLEIWELSDCPGFGYTYEFSSGHRHMAQNFEKNHENMNFPKLIQNQSGMVPGSPEHEKTSAWIHWKLPGP